MVVNQQMGSRQALKSAEIEKFGQMKQPIGGPRRTTDYAKMKRKIMNFCR
jgi:hypothetical protein